MDDEIEAALREIGGDALVGAWRDQHESTSVAALPTAYADGISTGYALALGAVAAVVDVALDRAFRAEMAERHRELPPEEQAKREAAVNQRMKELGVDTAGNGQPKMAMDWYQQLNDELGLRSPYRLRPRNHRILNHTDARTVIEMLMKGEAGFGDLRYKLFPGMSEAAARELYELHLAADRSSPASVPLRVMAWLWEQSVRTQAPDKVGAPNVLFALLQRFGPNMDWARWLNAFFGTDVIPAGASIGEAMLKLYDAGVLNQRVFWTSDLGAAVGGFKRRAVIAATLEVGVEVFALFEGVRAGAIDWQAGPREMAASIARWRDQPKYLDMRIIAQGMASAGMATRAVFTGDVLALNVPSLALLVRHLWVAPTVHARHTDRLVAFSQADSAAAIRAFQADTGIRMRPSLSVIEGGGMETSLDKRLHAAGCQSTRVRVLAARRPGELAPLVARIERLGRLAAGDDARESAFDAICETWYLADEENDEAAVRALKADLQRLETAYAS